MEKALIIEVVELKKHYASLKAVDGISLSVGKGEIFGLLGPNGAGKTTTMEMMEGLREPDEGKIIIKEMDAVKYRKKMTEYIGVQLQSTSMFDLLKVEEILRMYASFYKNSQPVDEILQQMALVDKRNDFVKSLSGGQKQRLAIGLALIHDPEIVFLDEPTTGLDPQARRLLWEVILKLKDQGKTIILSTHYMEEAYVLCDRLAIMDQGKIMVQGTPEQLISSLEMEAAIQFKWNSELEQFSEIPSVTKAVNVKDQTMLYTTNLQESLISLVKYAEQNHILLDQLQTRRATLEDVFLQLTGRSLKDE